MNIRQPISNLMTKSIITVSPNDTLEDVKKIFSQHRIHHLPVVRYKELIGMVSKSDFLHFIKKEYDEDDRFEYSTRLRVFKVADIMVEKLVKLSPDDKVDVALELFKENLFHAIPITKEQELVGVLTPYDIITALLKENTVPTNN